MEALLEIQSSTPLSADVNPTAYNAMRRDNVRDTLARAISGVRCRNRIIRGSQILAVCTAPSSLGNVIFTWKSC